MQRSMRRRSALAGPDACLLAAGLAAAALGGCGLNLQSPDLFALTRTGPGKTLTMLVNFGGSVRCDGHRSRMLPDSLLLVARDLAVHLAPDATRKLDLPSPPGSVYRYKVRLQDGTIVFPDTAAAHRPVLAQLEQFVQQALPLCGAAS